MQAVRKQGYQPTWEDGQEKGIGWRDAAGRYDAIKRYLVARMARTDLRQYPRPTVLDIGAYNGYFCRRLADDFGARCLAVDGQPFLQPYRPTAGVGYVAVDHALWSPTDIRERYKANGVNIILCLSILHHWPNWHDFMDAMSAVGSTLFVELANPNENLSSDARSIARAAHDDMRMTENAQLLTETAPMNGQSALRPLFVIETRKAHVNG